MCFFNLANFISTNYNHYYSKFLIRFIVKLVRFNFLFYAYKKILIKANNNYNYFDVKSHLIFGKKHRYMNKFVNKQYNVTIPSINNKKKIILKKKLY